MFITKSNSSIVAIDNALSDIRQGNTGDVPDHLKDSHYKGAEKLNRGVDYKYPHSFDNHWVKQQYLPDKIKYATYYEPVQTGKYEMALGKQWEWLTSQKKRQS